MLRQIIDIWWPKIHRDITLLTKTCPECRAAGKSIKPMLNQKQFGKLRTPKEVNEEIAIDFAGPFKIAKSSKKYLIVSIDGKTGWPDAKFMRAPTTNKVIEFLERYIADNGIPRKIRTDPGTVFTKNKFKQFCQKYFIQHIKCPIYDHRGNGKVERLIRTINERLRTNKRIILDKENTGLSEILYSIRKAPKSNNVSPAELQLGRKLTTIKEIITTKPTTNYNSVSDNDKDFELEISDFPQEQDSEIMVRERARGSKLEEVYKRKKGRITGETQHTLTMKESGKSTAQTFSKREIAKPQQLVQQSSQSKHTNPPQHKKDIKQTKTNEQQNTKKRREKKVPTEFKRLANWRELLVSEDEEENDQRRNERKQTNPPKTPIKATVNWEKPQLTKEEPESENETDSNTSNERPKRNRTTPDYYGNPVMICGIENTNEEGEREVITISIDEN